jgi:hypothetical protein
LLVILLALAFLLIAMTRSAPDLAHQIKRDREQELIERGTEYARAIGRFYRKFGRYPTRVEELESTNNIRFLRRRYKDPMTPEGEWRFVRFGEARLGSRGGTQTPGGIGTPAGGITSPATGTPLPGGATPARSGSTSGKTFGGGPIVGVASLSTATSIRERDGKTNYNEWEFVYDMTQDPNARQPGQPGQPGSPGRPGQPPGQPGAPTGQPQQPPTAPRTQ